MNQQEKTVDAIMQACCVKSGMELRQAIKATIEEMGGAAVRGEAVAECLMCNDTGDMSLGPTDYFGTCSCAAVARNAQSTAFIDAMPKRAAFIEWAIKKHLNVAVMKDTWGAQIFVNSHVQAMWTGWFSAPSAVSARAADAPSEPSEMYKALIAVREALQHANDSDSGGIVDTLWMLNGPETVFDFIDTVLESRAADALDSQPNEWLPTAEAINALPEGVRKYVHSLVANSDPAGTVAHNTLLTDNCGNLQVAYRKQADALAEVLGCFRAAEAEGLFIALAETNDERLKDLVERRLMHARYAAERIEVASSQPTDGGVRNG